MSHTSINQSGRATASSGAVSGSQNRTNNYDSSLESLLSSIRQKDLDIDGYKVEFDVSEIYLLAHIHVLPSYAKLMQFVVDYVGINIKKVIIIPKSYSAIPGTTDLLKRRGFNVVDSNHVHRLGQYDQVAWRVLTQACDVASGMLARKQNLKRSRAVLLDDGGMLTDLWSRLDLDKQINTVSIQQTTSGVFRAPHSRRLIKINVAGSAAKRHFESKAIAAGINRKIESMYADLKQQHIGIIGYGAVGGAIAKLLLTKENQVSVYDYARTVPPDLNISSEVSLRELVKKTDTIFGCTGRNVFANKDEKVLEFKNHKTLYSCSSRDTEFQTLIQKHGRLVDGNDPFANVDVSNGKITVANGGFPINFDRKNEWESEKEIALTRMLILSAILQAVCDFRHKLEPESNIVPLSTQIQRLVVNNWLIHSGSNMQQFGVSREDYESFRWWERESFATHEKR